MIKKILPINILAAFVLMTSIAGCSGPHADTKTGAVLGGAVGAATGAVIADDDLAGAAIGGVAGAALGGFLGHLHEENDR